MAPGSIVVCRFRNADRSLWPIALCLYVSRQGDSAVVRKALGAGGWRQNRLRWAKYWKIPIEDVIRPATQREIDQRGVIGGAEGEKAPPLRRIG